MKRLSLTLFAIVLFAALALALAPAAGFGIVQAQDPEDEEVDVRVVATVDDNGAIAVVIQQDVDGEWVDREISGWIAVIPALGAEVREWSSTIFQLSLAPTTVPVSDFGLPPSMIEPPTRPSDWFAPTRQNRGQRWQYSYLFNPDSGFTLVARDMKLVDGVSPSSNTEDVVEFNMLCSSAGMRQIVLTTDVRPLEAGGFEVAWWVDKGRPRVATWDSRAAQDDDFFFADAPSASGMIEELRNGTWLYLTIWGERSWRSAKLHITRLFETPVQELIDYCGQSGAEDERE